MPKPKHWKTLTLAAIGYLLSASLEASTFTFEERLRGQRAVEEVLWRQRIWPESNGAPNPAIEEGMNLAPRPNILIIEADDNSVSTYDAGLGAGLLPNTQALAVAGTTFTNSYVVDSLCCPSRATFLTGQHSHNHGVRSNALPLGGWTKLDATTTVAVALQAAGYRNGFVGKYLNGYTAQAGDPNQPGWDDWQALLGPVMYNYSLIDNGTIVSYGAGPSDYLTDVVAQRASDFLVESEVNDAQPWFLWVTPVAPHGVQGQPMCVSGTESFQRTLPAPRHLGLANALGLPQGPNFNETNVSDKPAWLRNNYPLLTSAQITCYETAHRKRVEAMMAVDDLLGSLRALLVTLGEDADTVVILTSDNGFKLGEHRHAQKQGPYEEDLRVPLYVAGYGLPVGQPISSMVLNLDLSPTILEWAQATALVPQDGRSLVPLLADPTLPWRSAFLFEHKRRYSTDPPDYDGVRNVSGWKYVRYVDRSGSRELYEPADPFELMSQHANPNPPYPAQRAAMDALLATLQSCVDATCWVP